MHTRLLRPNSKRLGAAIVAALGVLPAPVALAQAVNPDLVELRDGNSVLRTDLFKFNPEEAWFVDGASTLFTDLYFFNLGTNPAQRELRLEDFDQVSLQKINENQLLFNGQLSAFGGSLNFSLNSTLVGGAPGSFAARREDIIDVSFTGVEPLEFSLFSYIDYDLRLDQQFNNDTLTFKDNVLTQTDPSGLEATLVPITHTPSAVQFGEYPFLLAELYNDSRTILQPSAGPLVSTDGTAVLQFDETIYADQPLTFKFVKQVQKNSPPTPVPEPTVLVSLGVVLGGLTLLRRRPNSPRE